MTEILIIEDEGPAASRLKKMLEEVSPGVRVLGILESISSAVRWFREHAQPDLLLLDIQLADGLSFEIFSQVRVDSFVIFTTAYDEYAIKAFELNSIDYLLKPVDKEKLARSLEKYHRLHHEPVSLDIPALMAAMDHTKKSYKERFAVSLGSRIKSIEVTQIAYFYSMEKSTFLCTGEGRHYPIDFSLDKLEEILDPRLFFRISRQYTLQYYAIERIQVLSKSRVAIHIIPPTEKPLLVSTARTHQFRLWLDR
ncbi:MAG: LytR/AlgR family response regulator transcription factor [Bacteroidales bacterium]